MLSNIHLRGVDPHLLHRIKQEASREETSVNTVILNLLKRSLGLSAERNLPLYHDLDKYAGTWGKKQTDEFLKEISNFEQIDKEIWK